MPVDPIKRSLRRVAQRRKFEEAAKGRVRRRMAKAQKDLAELIRDNPIADISPGRRQQRVNSVVRRGKTMIATMYSDLRAITNMSLRSLSMQEAREVRAAIAAMVEVQIARVRIPGDNQLRAIVSSDLVQGAPLGKWWNSHNRGAQLAYQAQIQQGMIQGEGIDALVTRIRGVRGPNGNMVRGVISIGQQAAETLVRTSVTQVANKAAVLTYLKNSKLTEAYQYWAVLDDRTTEICTSLHSLVWRYDDPAQILPPQHWGCRSTIIPILLADQRGVS